MLLRAFRAASRHPGLFHRGPTSTGSSRVRAMATTTQDGAVPSAAAGQPKATPSPAAAIDFLMLLQKLKTTKRTGWVKRGVNGPESIADHMYRMGMMSMLLAGTPGVDYNRCIKMSIVHDVAESIVGDITPHCKVSLEDKARMEGDAIKQIQAMLGEDTHAAAEIAELWHEYEAGETPEALLVKDMDKLEMVVQAHEYESTQGLPLNEFFDSTAGRFKTGAGQAWDAEIRKRRAARQAASEAGKLAVEEGGSSEKQGGPDAKRQRQDA